MTLSVLVWWLQVQFRAAVNVTDKLRESELRLLNLIQDLTDRKADLNGLTLSEVCFQRVVQHSSFVLEHDLLQLPTSVVLPEHNTRIHIDFGEKDNNGTTVWLFAVFCCALTCSWACGVLQTTPTATTTTLFHVMQSSATCSRCLTRRPRRRRQQRSEATEVYCVVLCCVISICCKT